MKHQRSFEKKRSRMDASLQNESHPRGEHDLECIYFKYNKDNRTLLQSVCLTLEIYW